jgi:hypothetical protein
MSDVGRGKARHAYPCRVCGKTTMRSAMVKWPVACTPCLRRESGWTCQDCGSTDVEHPFPCPTVARRTLEWQIAEGSSTAHVIDTAKPAPKRTGAAALCKRRPQRNNRWWYALGVDEPGVEQSIRNYNCTLCPDCKDALPATS